MKRYQAALIALGGLLAALAWPYGLGNGVATAGLALVAAIAERGRVRLGTVTEVSISLLPTVFAAAVFGPLAAMSVALCSFGGDSPLLAKKTDLPEPNPEDAPYLKWGIYTCIRVIYA